MKTNLEVRLVRLANARGDMILADSAYSHLRTIDNDDLRYHIFSSMIVAYCRPFGPNRGIRNLKKEYKDYPDWPDSSLNLCHYRMIDLRDKFLAHSSTEGIRLRIIPRGAINPKTGMPEIDNWYDVAKRVFSYSDRQYFVDWLHTVIVALKDRVDSDIRALLPSYLTEHPDMTTAFEIDTNSKDFNWSIPREGQQGVAPYVARGAPSGER